MSAEPLFVLGTALAWIGWGCALAALIVGSRLAFKLVKSDPVGARRSFLIYAIVGGVCLLISNFIPLRLEHDPGPGWALPILWVYSHFSGWMFATSLFFVVLRLIQTKTALTPAEAKQRVGAAVVWVVVGAASLFWYLAAEHSTTLFRGAITVRPGVAVAIILLGTAAVMGMIASEKAFRSRGLAKGLVTHLTLLVGCVIFGVPFAWLLITSVKEDEDMSARNGIVWVPRVTLTHDYMDPLQPLARAEYDGQTVQAGIQLDIVRADGLLTLEVERPLSLRGRTFAASESEIERIPREREIVTAPFEGQTVTAFIAIDLPDGSEELEILEPATLVGQRFQVGPGVSEPVREVGLRWRNYSEALEYLPPETMYGLTYLKNTLILVFFSVVGTLLSCSFVAYGFSRLRFPGKEKIFAVMLATMMLPGAVTMLPGFLIFRSLGWIDTLYPLWVPTFLAGAFNVFLLRQFFMTIPMELEDSAKIDGATFLRTYWTVMLPQVKPAMAVIAIWTFMGAWNNFMGPLIFLNTPERMPIAYAVQLFQAERGGEFGLMMAFATMATLPVLLLFFFAQKYFIEGVQLSGLGGR